MFVTDVLADEGEKTAAEIGGTFVEHDVADPAQWAALVARVVDDHGRLDILVNNAGILRWERMADTSLESWNEVVAVNQTGVFLGMQAVAPQMKAQRSGSIVNISSVGGLSGASACFAYAATKWAVRGMTKGAAIELGPHGIKVNSIHPGHHRHADDGRPRPRRPRVDDRRARCSATRSPRRSPSSRCGWCPTTTRTPPAPSSSSTGARPRSCAAIGVHRSRQSHRGGQNRLIVDHEPRLLVERYRLGDPVGAGGMGTVYAALRPAPGPCRRDQAAAPRLRPRPGVAAPLRARGALGRARLAPERGRRLRHRRGRRPR